jgi:hypothetical protein
MPPDDQLGVAGFFGCVACHPITGPQQESEHAKGCKQKSQDYLSVASLEHD